LAGDGTLTRVLVSRQPASHPNHDAHGHRGDLDDPGGHHDDPSGDHDAGDHPPATAVARAAWRTDSKPP
jgi:hypothetical protein